MRTRKVFDVALKHQGVRIDQEFIGDSPDLVQKEIKASFPYVQILSIIENQEVIYLYGG